MADHYKQGVERNLYLIEAVPVGPHDEVMAMLPKHLERQVELEKQGILFCAGPIFNEGSDTPDAGLTIIRAESFEEARAIAEEDPMMKNNLRTYTLRRWKINEGTISLNVSLSDRGSFVS